MVEEEEQQQQQQHISKDISDAEVATLAPPQPTEVSDDKETPVTQAKSARISSNLSEKERHIVFYYLAKARGSLHTTDDDLSIEVYRKTCDFLRENNTRVPSHISIRKLWVNFKSSGKVTKKKGGGRKPKLKPDHVEEAAGGEGGGGESSKNKKNSRNKATKKSNSAQPKNKPSRPKKRKDPPATVVT